MNPHSSSPAEPPAPPAVDISSETIAAMGAVFRAVSTNSYAGPGAVSPSRRA